jgi:hypothetical protein
MSAVNRETVTAVPSVHLILSAVKLEVLPIKFVHKAAGLYIIARVTG